MNRIKKYFSKQYTWYKSNLQKIIFVVGLHLISSYVVNLPYINIFTSLFSFLPYFFDWIAILVLFKPNKELILKVGLLLFAVEFLLIPIKIDLLLEVFGQVSFFMLGTYVILSFSEIRK